MTVKRSSLGRDGGLGKPWAGGRSPAYLSEEVWLHRFQRNRLSVQHTDFQPRGHLAMYNLVVTLENILQCTGQRPRKRISQPQMSVPNVSAKAEDSALAAERRTRALWVLGCDLGSSLPLLEPHAKGLGKKWIITESYENTIKKTSVSGKKNLDFSIDNKNSLKMIATKYVNVVIQRSYRNLENSHKTTGHKYNK